MKTVMKSAYAAVVAAMLSIGALTGNAAEGDLFVSINGTGENGAGSIYQYTPNGFQTIFASGLSRPRGIVFDDFNNLFVANMTCDAFGNCQGTIVKITPGGAQSTFATLSEQNFQPEGLAFDRTGNLFVIAIDLSDDPNLASTIYKFTPAGVQTTFGTLPFQSFGLAFDCFDNLFAACAGVPPVANSATIYKFTPDGNSRRHTEHFRWPIRIR
jgi:sugar lactone lactonase YvrE